MPLPSAHFDTLFLSGSRSILWLPFKYIALLASGGSHGRVLVWDLNDLSKDEIPTFEVLLMFWYHRSAMVITTLKLLEFYIRLRKDNTVAVLRLVFSVA